MRFSTLLMATCGLCLTSCASLEPEPCTSEWISFRTDQVTSQFRDEFGPEIRDLAAFSRRLENPSPLLLIQMTARLSDFESMVDAFSDTVMPELKSAIDQCGTPTKFVSAFSGLLREQGVDGTVLDWVEEAAVLIEDDAAD